MKLEMSFDYKKLLKTVSDFIVANRIVLSSALLLIIGGLVLLRINSLTASELDAITELNNSSVEITSDFTNRNNPFVDN